MTTKHIIYVPGKNPKPQAAQHRELLWKTLLEGVRRADSEVADALINKHSHFHLVSWNYLYYHCYRDITPDILWVDALINQHGPSKQDIKEAKSWAYRLDRILFNLADHLHFIIPLLPEVVKSASTETNHYFENTANIASEIRQLLKQTLIPLIKNNEQVLLIGHSLGSVIAYDTLWELTHQDDIHGKIDFLTLGSPLGMHYVQRRLMGMRRDKGKTYPRLIRRWINISSEGDIIALERNFHNSFKGMLKQGLLNSIEDHGHGIYNHFHNEEGLNCHRSYGYLVNPAVGSIIADWWETQLIQAMSHYTFSPPADGSMSPKAWYEIICQQPDFIYDAAQASAIAELDALWHQLIEFKTKRNHLLGRSLLSPAVPKGLYFWGGGWPRQELSDGRVFCLCALQAQASDPLPQFHG